MPVSVHENCKDSVTHAGLLACKAIRDRWRAVLPLFAEILSDNNANQAAEAYSLLKALYFNSWSDV